MKKFLIVIVGGYFAIGFSFAMVMEIGELKTFQCVNPSAPNGYHTIGTGLFSNPDPAHCVRRGLTMQYLQNIPLHTVFWGPLIGVRVVQVLMR